MWNPAVHSGTTPSATLEGKTLTYQTVQGHWQQDLYIWPTCFEERSVEATLAYCYRDHTAAEKDFLILLILRLSGSTDIIALEHSLPRSSDWRPLLLKVSVYIAPHLVDEKLQPQESYVMELVGHNEELCRVSLQQAGVVATSKAISHFLR
ncbi:hypothetical protein C2845_PM03G19230 [Panicum miliaceum]|uniref:Uncharacterized protein n=1 Tax=Panicum miliaceum TaxID=4540 RepID=A0A3L6T9W5_PANMI|nr:hypothetical protein C2845_PM03G19230 [Panicum miliaceum]